MSGSEPSSTELRDTVARLQARVAALEENLEVRRRADNALQYAVDALSGVTGEAFFRSLVKHLAAALQVRFVFVAERTGRTPPGARILALWSDAGHEPAFSYELEGTPCSQVVGRGPVRLSSGLAEQFPDCDWVGRFQAVSYLAVPLFDSNGRPLGHMGVLHDAPMPEGQPAEFILTVFAGRTAAEIERRQTEEKLRASQRRVNQVIDSLPIVLMSMEANTNRTLLVMGAIEEIFGCSAGAFLSDPDHGARLVHPEDAHEMYLAYVDGLARMEPFELSYRILHAVTGEPVWLRQHIVPIAGPDGSLVRQDCVIVDITQRRRAEEALRESEERYRLLAESAQDVIFIITSDMCVQYVNQQAAGFLRLPADAVMGRPLRAFFPPDRYAEMETHLRTVLESGEPFSAQNRFDVPQGPIWLDTLLVPILNRDGAVSAVMGISRDITTRKQADQALQESEARFRMLTEHALTGVYIFRAGRFRYVNPAFVQLFGYAADQLVDNLGPIDIIHPDDRKRCDELIRSLLEGRVETIHDSFRGVCQDGSVVHCESLGRMIEYEGAPAVMGTLLNVSERKEREEQLRFLTSAVEQSFEGIVLVDLEGHLMFCNRAFAAMHGYAPEEVLGKHLSIFHTPEQMLFVNQVLGQIRETGVFDGEMDRVRRDGVAFPARMHNTLIRDPEGRPVAMMAMMRDITQEKEAQQALERSERLFRTAMQSLIVGAYIYQEGRFRYVNPAWKDIFGYSVEEVLDEGFDPMVLVHPDDRAMAADHIRRRLTGETDVARYTFRGIHKDGHKLYCEALGRRVDYEGRPAIFGTILDLTERRQAEEDLRRSEEALRIIVEGSPGFFFYIHDTNGVFTYVSPSVEAITGRTQEEWKTHYSTYFTDNPVNQEVVRRTERTLADGTTTESYPVEIEHADGQRILLQIYERPIIRDGEVFGIQGVAHDVTERKRAENAVRESEALYRSLVETSPDGIALTDLDAVIQMANQRVAELAGFEDPDEMLGRHGFDFFAPQDRQRARANLERVARLGTLPNVEYQLLRRDGSSYDGEISASVVVDAEGKPRGFISVVRDVTERNRLQQQLLQSQKLESIGTLAGGIAHDFNNLLAVIVGNASILHRRAALPKEFQSLAGDILDAAERGSALTQQLLAYARGGLQKPVPVDLKPLVQSVLDMLKRTAPPRIEFSRDLSPGLPPVMADPTQIEQVVMNLCLNAIQASESAGRIHVATRLERPASSEPSDAELGDGAWVCLRVQDEGCGMDAETQKRIFEPFFTTKPMGRGMGLAAAQGIVHSHKGRIEVDSTPGKGTTVSVWLPIAEEKAPAPEGPSPPERADPPRGTETVLVIDQDEAVTRTVGHSLSSLGYVIVARTDADEALAFLDTNGEDIDLVLLSLDLPERSCEEMLGEIHARLAHLPVVLTSGSADEQKLKPLMDRGAVGFVQKPFTLMALATAARSALDQAV